MAKEAATLFLEALGRAQGALEDMRRAYDCMKRSENVRWLSGQTAPLPAAPMITQVRNGHLAAVHGKRAACESG